MLLTFSLQKVGKLASFLYKLLNSEYFIIVIENRPTYSLVSPLWDLEAMGFWYRLEEPPTSPAKSSFSLTSTQETVIGTLISLQVGQNPSPSQFLILYDCDKEVS